MKTREELHRDYALLAVKNYNEAISDAAMAAEWDRRTGEAYARYRRAVDNLDFAVDIAEGAQGD